MPTCLPGQTGRRPRPAGPAAHPPKDGTLETQRLPAGARRKFRIMIEFDIRPTDHPVPDTDREENGSITMFRPDANAARFNSTARRMAMPELPPETFIRALELLVAQDREWVPGG